uniref:Uncharacterized protein n=1 Tax=Dictyoglomus turgidum TaxID=513050 RepID=A0A7C3WMM5_9BACT
MKTAEEMESFILLRSLEWANWPLFISQFAGPILLIYIPWWQLLIGIIVLNWIWALVRYRYQSIELAMLGAFLVKFKWPISIIMAIYFLLHDLTFLSFLSLFWPIWAHIILVFLTPRFDLNLIQQKFSEKIFKR